MTSLAVAEISTLPAAAAVPAWRRGCLAEVTPRQLPPGDSSGQSLRRAPPSSTSRPPAACHFAPRQVEHMN
jgi:hypothetical protein